MSKLKEDSLVKKFAKGAPVAVERGGDPNSAARKNEKARDEALKKTSDKKNDMERISSRLSEAGYER